MPICSVQLRSARRRSELLGAPQAAAGHLHPDRGVSLRFPRFIRLRPDKTPEEASGPEVIVELFNKQTRRVQNAAEKLGRGQ